MSKFMGNSRSYIKNGSNHIGEYCDKLIGDFFNFCDGNPQKITTMVWIKDILTPMPPSTKQMGILLSRLDVIWKQYCKQAKLPNETRFLFIKKVKEKWMELGMIQRGELPLKSEGVVLDRH